MRPGSRLARLLAGLLVAALGAGTVAAGELAVTPVNGHLAAGAKAAALTLTNAGTEPTAFQIRAFAWGQTATDDPLTPTDDLLVSPPLGKLAAGARQTLRLVLRRQPVGREATYRILIDEIPPPAAPGAVRVALRLSIPVFAAPATAVATQLGWRVERDGAAAWLVAINTGNRRASLRDLQLTTAAGARLPIVTKTLPYVLAGATRRWPLAPPLPALGQVLRLTAGSGDAKAIDTQVTVTGVSPVAATADARAQ